MQFQVCHPQRQAPVRHELRVALLALPYPGSVIIARPLIELGSHIRNFKLPPLELLARSIKVLVLGIFRGHLCDRVMLTSNDGILHSLKGRIEKEDIQTLQTKYPYMLENALVLVFNKKSDPNTKFTDTHPHHDQYLGGDLFVRLPDFKDYKEISAQTIREYYHNFYGIDITNKETGNSLKDIFKSKQFNKSSF